MVIVADFVGDTCGQAAAFQSGSRPAPLEDDGTDFFAFQQPLLAVVGGAGDGRVEYAVGLVATEVGSCSGIGQAYICTRVYQGRACGEPKQCALREGTVCLAGSENLRGVEREEVRSIDRQSTDIPTVVRVDQCCC